MPSTETWTTTSPATPRSAHRRSSFTAQRLSAEGAGVAQRTREKIPHPEGQDVPQRLILRALRRAVFFVHACGPGGSPLRPPRVHCVLGADLSGAEAAAV